MSAALRDAVALLHFAPQRYDDVVAGRVGGLDARERALVAATDRRAFRTDPERPLRMLAVLLAEAPVSAAIAGAAALPGFFASTEFATAVLTGAPVVDAFCAWLRPTAFGAATLEGAIAQARRRGPLLGDGVRTAEGVGAAVLPEGTLAHYAAVLAELGADPAGAAARSRGRAARSPEGAVEHVVITHAHHDARVGGCGEALATLLTRLEVPASLAQATAVAAELGAGDEAAELVQELLADGLLAGGAVSARIARLTH